MPGNDITINILGRSRDFERAIRRASDKADGFGSKMAGLSRKIASVAAVAGAAFAGIGLAVGKELFEVGAQLEAVENKARTVFEDQLPVVSRWARENSAAFGLTRSQLTGLAANFADLLVPMGFTREEAAKMSTDVVGLSGALAEWSGGQVSSAEAADILSKAMLGERESLKTLGISILDADVKARLAAKGQEELTGAALEQAKAVATAELIFEKSTDAQTAWAEGQNKSLRAANKLKAGIGEIKETLARAFLPIASRVVEWASRELPGAFAAGQRFVAEWGPKVRDVIERVADTVGDVVDRVRGFIDDFTGRFDDAEGGISRTTGRIGRVLDTMKNLFVSVFGLIRVTVERVVGAVTFVWEHFGDNIVKTAKAAIDTVVGVLAGLLEALDGIIKFITSVFKGDWSGAWDAIKQILSGVWDAIVALVEGAWDLLKLAVDRGLTIIKLAWDAGWNALKSFVGTVFDAVVGFVKALPGNIRDELLLFPGRLEDAWNAAFAIAKTVAGKVLDEVVEFFQRLPGRILAFAGSVFNASRTIGSKIGEGIAQGLRDTVHQIGEQLGVVNFQSGSNFVGGATRGATGTSQQTTSVVPFQPAAHGLVVSRPTMALIGENPATTPEIVSPVAMMRRIVREEAGAGTVVIPVHIGGEKIDTVVVNAVNRHRRFNGPNSI